MPFVEQPEEYLDVVRAFLARALAGASRSRRAAEPVSTTWPGADRQVGDLALAGRGDVVLHLHRLEDAHDVARPRSPGPSRPAPSRSCPASAPDLAVDVLAVVRAVRATGGFGAASRRSSKIRTGYPAAVDLDEDVGRAASRGSAPGGPALGPGPAAPRPRAPARARSSCACRRGTPSSRGSTGAPGSSSGRPRRRTRRARGASAGGPAPGPRPSTMSLANIES